MDKLYVDFINEITKEELYEGLLAYGLFSENFHRFYHLKDFMTIVKIKP